MTLDVSRAEETREDRDGHVTPQQPIRTQHIHKSGVLSHLRTCKRQKMVCASPWHRAPTLGQGPDVALVVQDKVQSCWGVHDGSDTSDTGQLQQSVGDTGAATTGETFQRLHQQVQTTQLQELHHPGLITGLQPPPQTWVVHHGRNLEGAQREVPGGGSSLFQVLAVTALWLKDWCDVGQRLLLMFVRVSGAE